MIVESGAVPTGSQAGLRAGSHIPPSMMSVEEAKGSSPRPATSWLLSRKENGKSLGAEWPHRAARHDICRSIPIRHGGDASSPSSPAGATCPSADRGFDSASGLTSHRRSLTSIACHICASSCHPSPHSDSCDVPASTSHVASPSRPSPYSYSAPSSSPAFLSPHAYATVSHPSSASPSPSLSPSAPRSPPHQTPSQAEPQSHFPPSHPGSAAATPAPWPWPPPPPASPCASPQPSPPPRPPCPWSTTSGPAPAATAPRAP